MYRKLKSIEAMRLESECETCRLINATGVNSPETIRNVSEAQVKRGFAPVFTLGWIAFLDEHEAYEAEQGNTIPTEWTSAAIDPTLKERVFTRPEPKPVIKYEPKPKRDLSEEEKALASFKLVYRPVIHQHDGRIQRPIIKKLDTTPLQW